MKNKCIKWAFIISVLLGVLALLAAPFYAFSQETNTTPVAVDAVASADEENVLALLKAMCFQVLNSPASLLVILGLTIISTSLEILIRAVDWVSNKLIYPLALCLCVFGGAFSYWLFSPDSSVDKAIFPHPQPVLFVNGLICGVAAFIAHSYLVKFLVARQDKPPETK